MKMKMLKNALVLCALLAAASASAAEIRELSFMTAMPVASAPKIDGELTDDAWSRGVANTTYYEYLKPSPKVFTERKTSCTVVYDAQGVYVGVRNWEPEMANLKRNVVKNRDTNMWMDDCAEIFFDPHANGVMFYKFVVNANGKWDSSWRMDAANYHSDWTFPGIDAAATRHDDRWDFELFVPWAAFGLSAAPKPGTVWTFDHNRFLWLRRSWPLCSTSAPGAAHAAPERFGYLYFSDGAVPAADRVLGIVESRLAGAWGIQIGGKAYLHDENGTRGIDETLQTVFKRLADEAAREQAQAETNLVRLLAGSADPVPPLDLTQGAKYDFATPKGYDGFNGHYRHNPRPGLISAERPPKTKLANPPRVLFLTGFGGEIRDMLELAARYEMEALFFPGDFGQTGIYSDFVSLGTAADKERQFLALLAKRPTVTVVKGFNWTKIPTKYQVELVRRVRDEGMGLLFLGSMWMCRKVVRPDTVRRLGKGIVYATEKDADPHGLYDKSGDWILDWQARYEARAKRLMALVRKVQGLDDVPCDEAKPAPARAGRLTVASRDNVVPEDGALDVAFSWEKPLAKAAKLELEVRTLPHRELVRRETRDVPAGATGGVSLTLGPARFPTLAGFVSARLVDADGEAAKAARVYYFPNHRFEDYTRIVWDRLDIGGLAPFVAPQIVDVLGYDANLGERGGMSALFNARSVPYTAHVSPVNAESGATLWRNLDGFTLGWGNKRPKPVIDQLKKEGEINPNDPRVIKLIEDEFPFQVTNTAKYGVCVWSLGDECGFNYESGHGKTDKKPFADFLRGKYGTVEKFNAVHGTSVADFDAAPHKRLKEALADRDWPAWWDHVQYMDKTYADTFKLLSKVIKRTDPKARVGAEGSQPGDVEQTVDGLEYWGPYRNLMDDEVLRNIAPDRVRGVWWGGYPDSRRDGFPHEQWEYLLTGVVNADMWFQIDPVEALGCLAGDFTIAPYVERMVPHLRALRRGVAQTLINTPFRNDGFAVYYSYASVQASKLDDAFLHPKSGFVSLIRFCYRNGYDFRVVTPRLLDRLADVRVLFLPGCTALSDAEVQAIAAFEKRGGLVVADSEPGRLDAFFARRAGKPGFASERTDLTCVAADDGDIRSYDARIQAFLSRRGIRPHESISGLPLSQTIFRVRELDGLRLAGFKALGPVAEGQVKIALDRPGFVYEVDRGFVGEGSEISVSAGAPFRLFAVFDKRPDAPAFGSLREGGVYRLMAIGADGREIAHRAMVFVAKKGRNPADDFFVPLDEAPGVTYRLRDIATGLEAQVSLPARREISRDVVIYGSTSAALSAAVQAKRMGLDVVVVSPETRIGGLTTGGLGQTDIGNMEAFGGIAREFYRGVADYYRDPANWKWQKRSDYLPDGQCTGSRGDDAMWTFEPSAALKVLEGWERRDKLDIRRGERLDRGKGGVVKSDGRIVAFRTLAGNVYRGKMFVDATYEGDLLAAAGVSYVVGREANGVYGETLNGTQVANATHHNFVDGVDPYVVKGDKSSGLLPFVESGAVGTDGAGDRRVQAYCFRMCLTDVPENRIPFAKPADYDERDYELLFRNYEAGEAADVPPWINSKMPNRKTDTNNRRGFSTDFVGQNWAWPEASYAEREKILKAHLRYQRGLMWTLANHPRVPETVRREVSKWGTCRDEFADGLGDGWQRQLYVREARRLVGEVVMTEAHCRKEKVAARPVAMAAYQMDSHHVRRYVTADGWVKNEGDVEVLGGKGPFGIDYGAIVPKRGECANLFVPVCLSASHMAFGSIRMEPVFFALGQAAGTAAALAIEGGVAVQDVPYAKLRARLLADKQVVELGPKP